MPKSYQQLTKEERDRLSLLKIQGKSLREIAGLLGRNVSTISRELKRNSRPFHSDYLSHRAQDFADVRKAAGHPTQNGSSSFARLVPPNGLRDNRREAGNYAQRGTAGRQNDGHEG